MIVITRNNKKAVITEKDGRFKVEYYKDNNLDVDLFGTHRTGIKVFRTEMQAVGSGSRYIDSD